MKLHVSVIFLRGGTRNLAISWICRVSVMFSERNVMSRFRCDSVRGFLLLPVSVMFPHTDSNILSEDLHVIIM